MKLPELDISAINGKFPFIDNFWCFFLFLMHVMKIEDKKFLYIHKRILARGTKTFGVQINL